MKYEYLKFLCQVFLDTSYIKLDEEFRLNDVMDDLEVKSEDLIDELEDLLQNIF